MSFQSDNYPLPVNWEMKNAFFVKSKLFEHVIILDNKMRSILKLHFLITTGRTTSTVEKSSLLFLLIFVEVVDRPKLANSPMRILIVKYFRDSVHSRLQTEQLWKFLNMGWKIQL